MARKKPPAPPPEEPIEEAIGEEVPAEDELTDVDENGVSRVRAGLTISVVAAALQANAGLVSQTAEKLGVSRQAVHQFIGRHPELQTVQANIDEIVLDLAQGGMIDKLKAKDGAMIRYVLDRKGKARGFTTKQQHEVQHSLPDGVLEGIIDSFGGDVAKLRAFLERLP